MTLGRYGPGGLSLAEARERCMAARKLAAQGLSPALEKRRVSGDRSRRLSEISPDDFRALCAKVKERGAPATAIHVGDIDWCACGYYERSMRAAADTDTSRRDHALGTSCLIRA